MKLASLNLDLLALIFASKQHSFLVLPLWLCGDVVLNRKLAQCITMIDLKDSREESKSLFPRLLFSFPNLRHLSLDRGYYNLGASIRELQQLLLQLPTSRLETLKIRCAEAQTVLRVLEEDYATNEDDNNANGIGDDRVEDPSAESTSRGRRDEDDFGEDEDGLPSTELLDLKSIFPRLTTFKLVAEEFIGDDYGYYYGQVSNQLPTIFGADLAKLPSSLTQFSGTVINLCRIIPNVDSLFEKLPPSITALKIDLRLEPKDQSRPLGPFLHRLWSNCPPSLTTLRSFSLISNVHVSIDYLPKSLSKGSFDIPTLLPSDLKLLPPHLEILSVPFDSADVELGYASDWASDLPPHLKSLYISLIPPSFDLFARLPKSLTSLYMEERSPDFEYDLLESAIARNPDNFWPPQLQVFKFPEWMLPMDKIGLLPRTVTHLTLKVLITGDFPSSLLPPALTHLQLIAMTTHISSLVFEYDLPPSLTHLKIHASSGLSIPQSLPSVKLLEIT